MTSFSKFNIFTTNLVDGAYNFSSDTIKIMLTNSAPSAANSIPSDITEITAHNGYSAGGATSAVTVSTSTAEAIVKLTNITITASGGTIGPFRYIVIYDSTSTKLIGWSDYASNLTLNDGDKFNVNFDATNGLFNIP